VNAAEQQCQESGQQDEGQAQDAQHEREDRHDLCGGRLRWSAIMPTQSGDFGDAGRSNRRSIVFEMWRMQRVVRALPLIGTGLPKLAKRVRVLMLPPASTDSSLRGRGGSQRRPKAGARLCSDGHASKAARRLAPTAAQSYQPFLWITRDARFRSRLRAPATSPGRAARSRCADRAGRARDRRRARHRTACSDRRSPSGRSAA
jgi:hypothetical protein